MTAKRTAPKRGPGGQRHTRYTDDFRATAVAAAIAAGYPSIKGALLHTAQALKISHQLLRNWITAQQNPPPQELLQVKKADLRSLMQSEVVAILGAMPTKRGDATYSQLATAYGILFDKIRLLDGLPTEILGMLPELMNAIGRRHMDATEIVRNLINELDSENLDVERENVV